MTGDKVDREALVRWRHAREQDGVQLLVCDRWQWRVRCGDIKSLKLEWTDPSRSRRCHIDQLPASEDDRARRCSHRVNHLHRPRQPARPRRFVPLPSAAHYLQLSDRQPRC